MSFAAPLFLLLGLLAGPVVLMYMLRLRRQEVVISSTMLWRRLLRDREANAPWQRLRRNLLLILQLLILAALTLALARPFIPVSSVVSGSVVVLLDGSASMLATDVEPNRFAAARERVEALVSDLGSRDQMTLILVGGTPQVLASATSNKVTLRQALDGIRARPVAADWDGAIALAAGAVQGFLEARVVIVSDGGLPADLPPLPATVVYLPIGTSGENMAISALSSRETPGEPQLFAAVTNYGQREGRSLVGINLDGLLFDSKRVTIPPGETATLTWELPRDTKEITLRLSGQRPDVLRIDDVAWAVRQTQTDTKALLIGQGNRFLETAFSVLPGGIEVARAETSFDYNEIGQTGYDLLVLDGVPLAEPPPDIDLLIIDPVGFSGSVDSTLYDVTGVFSDTTVVEVTESPISTYVDWNGINVLQAKRLVSSWVRPLVVAEGGPLLLAGEDGGRRAVILPFRLQESDLPLQIAFPVLMANITSWLNPGRILDTASTINVGDTVPIFPRADTSAVSVTLPDGEDMTMDASGEALIFNQTDQPGLYRVSVRKLSGDEPAGSFAVNLFSPVESAIAPAESLSVGQKDAESGSGELVGQRHLWPWLAGLAFIVLLIEWWIFHRGSNLPDWSGPNFWSPFRRQ